MCLVLTVLGSESIIIVKVDYVSIKDHYVIDLAYYV